MCLLISNGARGDREMETEAGLVIEAICSNCKFWGDRKTETVNDGRICEYDTFNYDENSDCIMYSHEDIITWPRFGCVNFEANT